MDITESDLISLNLLQRAIATARGVPLSTPIVINYGYDEPDAACTPKPGTITTTTTTTTTVANLAGNDNDAYSNDDDRYYSRRSHHRKRKQYVPSRPVTAFDELINEIKLQNTGMAMSDITEIALKQWNKLTSIEKEKYEREALHANSDYVMG
ncbi:hypothetical protein [Parasitella parasitica]|uniref:HMG box domain-containing protein n=1 Tax=Parasitella parasitica TaxID=35722 RepID=A0A0B7N1X3_9FUNG|nr:hypothetical protein [Parasitella parasitica]